MSLASWNAGLDAALNLLNGGTIQIYSGTQPATPDTALSGNTLLATLALSATAFGSSAAGVKTAAAVTSASAVATGTASFFRAFKSDGVTAVIDGSVGTSGADLNLNDINITSGGTVSVTSWTVSAPSGQ